MLAHSADDLSLGRPENLPDFLRLQKSGEVSVAHLGHGQVVALLSLGGSLPGAIQLVQFLECRLGPDDEAANMTTRGQLQKVHLGDGDAVNAGDVTECTDDTLVGAINDQRTATLDATTVAHFTLTSSQTAGFVHLQHTKYVREHYTTKQRSCYVRNLCPPNRHESFVEGMPRKLIPMALNTYAEPMETTAIV